MNSIPVIGRLLPVVVNQSTGFTEDEEQFSDDVHQGYLLLGGGAQHESL